MDNHEIIFQTLNTDSAELDPTLKLYVDTFKRESITSYNFNFNDPQTEKLYYEAVQLMAPAFIVNGDDFIVATLKDKVVGLALINKPGKTSLRKTMNIIFPDIFKLFPLLTKIRYRNLFASGKAMRLSEPLPENHVTLQVIAVSPNYQGQGIGKTLLQNVQKRYANDFDGIYLYTANVTNKDIYQHLGYELLEETQGGNLTVYHMVYRY